MIFFNLVHLTTSHGSCVSASSESSVLAPPTTLPAREEVPEWSGERKAGKAGEAEREGVFEAGDSKEAENRRSNGLRAGDWEKPKESFGRTFVVEDVSEP